jgi:hypothetical protein
VVSNVVANLAALSLSPATEPDVRLSVATEKRARTRYDRPDFARHLLAPTLKALEDAGMVARWDYTFKERCTQIEPTLAFEAAMHGARIASSDIGRVPGAETIWLFARTGRRAFGGSTMPKTLVSYRDTPEAAHYRAETERINSALNAADIKFDGQPQPPVFLWRNFTLRTESDPEAFDLGGRLFGGFWMNLAKRDRHRITVGGEPLADLDYSAMFARLAYVLAGEPAPSFDPYAIPGLEMHRDGAKTALLSLLSRSSPMKALTPELKALLPEGWTAERLVDAVTLRHPRIAPLFGRDLGLELMALESKVLVAVLLSLINNDVPALGMHDGLFVPAPWKDLAADVMRSTALEVTGVELPVVEKTVCPSLKITCC